MLALGQNVRPRAWLHSRGPRGGQARSLWPNLSMAAMKSNLQRAATRPARYQGTGRAGRRKGAAWTLAGPRDRGEPAPGAAHATTGTRDAGGHLASGAQRPGHETGRRSWPTKGGARKGRPGGAATRLNQAPRPGLQDRQPEWPSHGTGRRSAEQPCSWLGSTAGSAGPAAGAGLQGARESSSGSLHPAAGCGVRAHTLLNVRKRTHHMQS